MNERLTWPSSISTKAYLLGLIGSTEELLLGGPSVGDDEMAQATEAVNDLLQLISQLPERAFGGDLRSFAAAMNFTPQMAEACFWGGEHLPDATTFARADVVRTADGFKVVEINVGGAVSLTVQHAIPALVGLHQGDDALSNWARHVAARVPRHGVGAIVTHRRIMSYFYDEGSPMVDALVEAGCEKVLVCRVDELRWDGRQLYLREHALDWIYPRYTPEDIPRAPASYAAARSAIEAGKVVQASKVSCELLSSKLALAWLWKLKTTGGLSASECTLVDKYLPATYLLDESRLDFALDLQADAVLKPAMRYGGSGVVIGCEVSHAEWEAHIRSALAQPSESFIIQRRCRSVTESVVVAAPYQPQREYEARLVWGFFVADGEACGGPVLRAKPVSDSGVISRVGGAATGALVPTLVS